MLNPSGINHFLTKDFLAGRLLLTDRLKTVITTVFRGKLDNSGLLGYIYIVLLKLRYV
jgi:hypothetical protein